MSSDSQRIKSELAKVGVLINDIFDLVNTNQPYPTAVPILIDFLEKGIDDIVTKEGVIRALGVKEAIGKANPVLLEEYGKVDKSQMLLRWAIGNTIHTIITNDDVEGILPIVTNKENGMSRQMFVAALGKVKSEKVEDTLIHLLDDEEVTAHSLDALGRMRSQKAKEKISILIDHPKTLIRKAAQKALKRIS